MAGKHLTYNISVSFQMQYTFPESEVEQSDEGDEGDLSPTDEALEALEQRIAKFLAERFGQVREIKAWADFDDLLGVVKE